MIVAQEDGKEDGTEDGKEDSKEDNLLFGDGKCDCNGFERVLANYWLIIVMVMMMAMQWILVKIWPFKGNITIADCNGEGKSKCNEW